MGKNSKSVATAVLSAVLPCAAFAAPEISVALKLDETSYVVGERVRGVVDVENFTTATLDIGSARSPDVFFIELFRSHGGEAVEPFESEPWTVPFRLETNKGIKLEVFIDSHFPFYTECSYIARPVVVHGGIRYEGAYRAFSIVPGMKVGEAVQMFSGDDDLRREFTLVKWNRRSREHLFLAARDVRNGVETRSYRTVDLGRMMRMTPPVISVVPSGEVFVLHRTDRDYFARSEFWSMKNALEFRGAVSVQDPETAAQSSIQDIYSRSGGVQPKKKPWWKFW